MCGLYYCITCRCKSHLHLVSFLFVPLKFKDILVSSLFVLSDVIVEDTVGLCTCTYKKAKVYYSIVLYCGMYEEYCLPTNCDNVVSCIKTIFVPSGVVCQCSCGTTDCLQIVGVVCCGLKQNCGDVVM